MDFGGFKLVLVGLGGFKEFWRWVLEVGSVELRMLKGVQLGSGGFRVGKRGNGGFWWVLLCLGEFGKFREVHSSSSSFLWSH